MTAQALPRNDDLAAFPGVVFGERRLDLPDGMEFDEWMRLGEVLHRIAENSLFWLGEWAIYGERAFGERYAQAISNESGYAVETVRVAQWVAERVPADRRHPDLSWAHHRAVATLAPEEQEAWLGKAASEGLTTKELYERTHDRKENTPDGEPPHPAEEAEPVAIDAAFHAVLVGYVSSDEIDDVVTRLLQVLRSRGMLEAG